MPTSPPGAGKPARLSKKKSPDSDCVRIVRVGHDDPRIRALHVAAFPADREPDWVTAAWWLVLRDDRPVAFAGVQRSQQWCDAGYMVRAGVEQTERGRRLQQRLIRVRERFARRQGWKWLFTATLNNPPSANSLIACGFRLYEPAAPWLAAGALYWRKRVQA